MTFEINFSHQKPVFIDEPGKGRVMIHLSSVLRPDLIQDTDKPQQHFTEDAGKLQRYLRGSVLGHDVGVAICDDGLLIDKTFPDALDRSGILATVVAATDDALLTSGIPGLPDEARISNRTDGLYALSAWELMSDEDSSIATTDAKKMFSEHRREVLSRDVTSYPFVTRT